MMIDISYQGLRSYARSRVLDLLGAFSAPCPGVHILNGHRVLSEQEPETFKHMLEQLSQHVTFVRIEDAVQMIAKHQQSSTPVVAFTFDDGFSECYDVFAPVLENYGINAAFFINPNYVDGDKDYIDKFNNNIVLTPNKLPMRWKQIKELSERGFVIGAHTMDHRMVNFDDEWELRFQIEKCKATIEEKLNKACEYFAFPYGKLTHASLKAVDIACKTYSYVFSQSDYKHYFSFDGRVINRRHFEPFWPIAHVNYFLSCQKK